MFREVPYISFSCFSSHVMSFENYISFAFRSQRSCNSTVLEITLMIFQKVIKEVRLLLRLPASVSEELDIAYQKIYKIV